jgi:hypothetical protein
MRQTGVFELAKRRVAPLPSESGVYRALVRTAMIAPHYGPWALWAVTGAAVGLEEALRRYCVAALLAGPWQWLVRC